MKDRFPLCISAGFLVLVGALAVWLSSCNHGSNIPIDPTCVELVTDECVPEVIEEFCPPDEGPCVPIERHRLILENVKNYWYAKGFEDGVDSVVCETTDPVCEDDIDDDCEDDAHKKVHKRCKGEGHR